MPVYHATLFFCAPPLGWVEQFFRQDVSLAASLASAVALSQARFSILGQGVNLYRVRVSEVNARQVSASADVGGTTSVIPAMEPRTGAQILLVAGQGGLYRRTLLLRGLPQGALQQHGALWSFGTVWAGSVTSWLNRLQDGGWSLQCWGRDTPTYPIQWMTQCMGAVNTDSAEDPTTAFSPGPTDLALVAVEGTPALPPGNFATLALPTARIGRVVWDTLLGKQDGKPNGEFDIIGVTENVVAVGGVLPQVGSYLRGGYLQLRPRSYQAISNWSLRKLGAKACGPMRKDAVPPPAPGVSSAGPFDLKALIVSLAGGPTGPLGSLLQAPPLLPPAPPFIKPGPWPIPPAPTDVTLNTALDVISQIYQLTVVYEQGVKVYRPLQWAVVTNLNNTYFMGMSGTWVDLNPPATAPDLFAAINAGMNVSTGYVNTIVSTAQANFPPGANIIMAGYSQGGMVAELAAKKLAKAGFKVLLVETFGAPVIFSDTQAFVTIRRFLVNGDQVGGMSVQTLFRIYLLQASSITSQFIPVALDPNYPIWPKSHGYMWKNPDLQNWDALGIKLGPGAANKLQLGRQTRVQVNLQIKP